MIKEIIIHECPACGHKTECLADDYDATQTMYCFGPIAIHCSTQRILQRYVDYYLNSSDHHKAIKMKMSKHEI